MTLLLQALLASAQASLNAVLQLDRPALRRLGGLAGKVLEIDCQAPAMRLFILPDATGLYLAAHADSADCCLQAPANRLLQLALSADKTAVLHSPQVQMSGDSQLLLELADILQNLELDWQYEVSRWLGPVPTQWLSDGLQSSRQWAGDSLHSLRLNLADYLAEESRSLVGAAEAEARFAELDDLKLALDRLDARLARLTQKIKPDA